MIQLNVFYLNKIERTIVSTNFFQLISKFACQLTNAIFEFVACTLINFQDE